MSKVKNESQLNPVPITASDTPDDLTKAVFETSEQFNSELYRQRLLQEGQKTVLITAYTENLNHENNARKWYGKVIFGFVILYMIAVLVMTIYYGEKPISNDVLMMLLGTTSINVIGLLAAIVKYLFSSHHHEVMANYLKE